MALTAEYGLGEYTFGRGWYMVASVDELDGNKPLNVRYFGMDMVLYRGHSGRVVMLDAYCAHMGTHLGKNTTSFVVQDDSHIEGDSIRCPYHGWRFGPDGKCDDIPYSPAPIPKAACIPAYTVEEKAGLIFMWYDPEGGAPEYELPPFEEWDDPSWVRWKVDQLGQIACHPVEILDNMADKAHLEPVHGSCDMQLFENHFKDHVVQQILKGGHRTLAGSDYMTNDTWYTGPGILQSRMIGQYPSLMFICHTPVDDGVVRVWHGLMVKTQTSREDPAAVAMATEFQDSSCKSFSQDFEIWANKRACINPLVVQGDGPFGKVRIWYRQFYNPRARAHEFQSRVNGTVITKGTATAPWPNAAE